MAAGPVGTVWQSGTWPATTWQAGSWGNAVPPAIVSRGRITLSDAPVNMLGLSNKSAHTLTLSDSAVDVEVSDG